MLRVAVVKVGDGRTTTGRGDPCSEERAMWIHEVLAQCRHGSEVTKRKEGLMGGWLMLLYQRSEIGVVGTRFVVAL